MPDRPNLVVFIADQLRADALGCFGNPVASTPHHDALAERGVVFTQAFAQHSVCSPSRVSMFTGLYPHVAGHRTLTNLIKPWESDLLSLLHGAGYHVAWAGARGDLYAPGELEARTDVCGWLTPPRTLLPPDGAGPSPLHRAFWLGSRGDEPVVDLDEAAIRTAEQLLADGLPEPWILVVALLFPHPPFSVEEPWYSLHDRASMPAPVPAASTSGKARFVTSLRAAYGLDALTGADWAELRATYAGMVSRVDHHLGRLLGAVERAGATDRTAVVTCSDHGEYLGDFGLVEKWPSGLDDVLVRDPLIVSVPGARGGVRCDALVELVDLLPTLTELADVGVTHTHFGRSLLPLLADPHAGHRAAAFSEGGFSPGEEHLLEPAEGHYAAKAALQHEHPDLVGRAIAVRTAEHVYVYRPFEHDELYDRSADPAETTNLVDRPEHHELVRGLRDTVLEWSATTSDVIPWTLDPRFPAFPNGYRVKADA